MKNSTIDYSYNNINPTSSPNTQPPPSQLLNPTNKIRYEKEKKPNISASSFLYTHIFVLKQTHQENSSYAFLKRGYYLIS